MISLIIFIALTRTRIPQNSTSATHVRQFASKLVLQNETVPMILVPREESFHGRSNGEPQHEPPKSTIARGVPVPVRQYLVSLKVDDVESDVVGAAIAGPEETMTASRRDRREGDGGSSCTQVGESGPGKRCRGRGQ
jgi:hypothetical protein